LTLLPHFIAVAVANMDEGKEEGAMPEEKQEKAKESDACVFLPEHILKADNGNMIWQPVCVQHSVTVSGGQLKDFAVTDAMEVDELITGGVLGEVFVKLCKNSDWLLRCVGGKAAKKGGLCRSKVVEKLRTKLVRATQSQKCVTSSDSSSPKKRLDDEVDDLMNELHGCSADNKRQRPKVPKYTPKRQKKRVVEVTMPLHALGRSSGKERQVRVMAASTNTIWISKKDIPWLVCFVADEVRKGGVEMDDDDNIELEPNTDIPHLHMQWDFASGDTWLAQFVGGDLAGKKLSSSIQKLSQAKWDKLGGAEHFGVTLTDAPFAVKKAAVWEHLCATCKAMANNASNMEHDVSSSSAVSNG
jgi:hypothetical protein